MPPPLPPGFQVDQPSAPMTMPQPFAGPPPVPPGRTPTQDAIDREHLHSMQLSNAAQEDTLDPGTVDMLAHQYILSGQLPPLGMGRSATSSRQAVLNRAAQIAGVRSGESTQAGFARYRNGVHALQQQEAQLTAIRGNEAAALANGQQYVDRSAELPAQTNFTPWNNVANFVMRRFSNPTIGQMDIAHDNFANESARVVSASPTGTGVLSDSAREQWMSVLNGNYSVEAKRAALEQLHRDFDNRVNALNGNIARGYANLEAGRPVSSDGQPPMPPGGYSADDVRRSVSVAAAVRAAQGLPPEQPDNQGGPPTPSPAGGSAPASGGNPPPGSPAGGIANGIGAGPPVDHHGDAVVFGMDRTPPPPPPGTGPLPGGAEFAGALQAAIRSGRFHSVAEAMQFAQSLNPQLAQTVNQADLAAAIRNPRLAGVAVPHGSPPAPPSDPRGDPSQVAIQNALKRSIYNNLGGAGPMLAGPSQVAEMISGPEAGAAALRGSEDIGSLGLSSRMNALSDTIGQGGTYQSNLDRQWAIDDYDSANHPWARLGGEAVTGLPFAALGGETVGGQMLANGAFGTIHGFNSGRGSAMDRAGNALLEGSTNALLTGAVQPRATISALRGVLPSNAERQALVAAAGRQGVDLMRADTGGVGTRMASGIIGRTFGAIPLSAGARRSAASAGAAVDRVAADMGTVADAAGAGQASQRGMRSWLDTSKVRGDEIRDAVPIPAGTPSVTAGATAALRERTAGMPSNQMLGDMFRDPRLEGYLAAIEGRAAQVPTGVLDARGQPIMRTIQEGGGLNWEDMRRFRSLVGEMIDQPHVGGDGSSIAALRRLYAGLSQDMEATATQVSPRALTMVRRSIQYDRGRAARRDGVASDILGQDFSGSAEAAFERINRWSQTKGGNFANVAQALRSMPEQDANTVRASIFARMGDAPAARQSVDSALSAQQGISNPEFSPAEFSRQWNLMNDRAKSFLIPGAQHRADLNDLALITAGQKRASQFQNFSNTSLAGNAIAFFAGLQTAPLPTITAALGSLAAGKFLASAPGARWLAQGARMRTEQAVRSHIGRLVDLARRDPAIGPEVLSLRQNLLSAANDNTLPSIAASPDASQGNNQ